MGDDVHFDGGFTSESWEYATAFALSLGTLPTSVTSVVRLLLADYDRTPSALSDYGRFFVSRFLKSQTLETTYYYACKRLRPEVIPNSDEPFGAPELLKAFSGEEHAYLLAIIFYHRQAKRYCEQSLFENATGMLQDGINTGALIGKALPAVGMGTGILCGGFRQLAFFPFIRHDPDGSSKYLRHLRSKELLVDWNFEFERWQCNSLQVAIMILQRAGLGTTRLSKLMKAVGTRSPILPDDHFERPCRAVDIWYQCLASKRKTPSIPLPPQFYLGAQEAEAIIQSLATTSDPRSTSWLVRGKNDRTIEETPHLFRERQPESMKEADLRAPSDTAAMPAELAGTLPKEAVDSLSERLLQDILSVETD